MAAQRVAQVKKAIKPARKERMVGEFFLALVALRWIGVRVLSARSKKDAGD